MSGSGVGRGVIAGRSSKGCQKLHWEILCVHHLGDCWPCVLCVCQLSIAIPCFRAYNNIGILIVN